jgi:hypothetical protein
MTAAMNQVSPEIRRALEGFAALGPASVHVLQVGLAKLALEQAPPAAASQLALAVEFIEGRVGPAELKDAKQDCWTHVGSLACGCSIADSASAHAIMTCLETDPAAHTPAALLEQVERISRCGVAEARILSVLCA